MAESMDARADVAPESSVITQSLKEEKSLKRTIIDGAKTVAIATTMLVGNFEANAQAGQHDTKTSSEVEHVIQSSGIEGGDGVTVKGVTLTLEQYAVYEKKMGIIKKLNPTMTDDEASQKVLEVMQRSATIAKADQEIAQYDKRLEELRKEKEQMLRVIDELTQSIAQNKQSIEVDKKEIAQSKANIAANQLIIEEQKKLQLHYAAIKDQFTAWDNDMQVDIKRFAVLATQQKYSEGERTEMQAVIKKWEGRKFADESDPQLQAALQQLTQAWAKQVARFREILAQKPSNIAMSSVK